MNGKVGYVGQPLRRREDPRLLTGQGTYADDIQLPGTGSPGREAQPPHAGRHRPDRPDSRPRHGRRASPSPTTAPSRARSARSRLTPAERLPNPRLPPRHPLAHGTVRYVGDPVAVVVAETRALARDAVDAIEVDYTPRPGVVDVERALEPGAPRVFEDFEDNVACRLSRHHGDYAGAAREADVIVRQRIVNQRVLPAPMEPRCSVAHYLPATGELTLWSSTQIPHQLRAELARLLGMPTTGAGHRARRRGRLRRQDRGRHRGAAGLPLRPPARAAGQLVRGTAREFPGDGPRPRPGRRRRARGQPRRHDPRLQDSGAGRSGRRLPVRHRRCQLHDSDDPRRLRLSQRRRRADRGVHEQDPERCVPWRRADRRPRSPSSGQSTDSLVNWDWIRSRCGARTSSRRPPFPTACLRHMFMAKIEVLHLTPTERGELQSYLRKRNLPASVAQRMGIVLLLDEGTSYRDIEEKLGAAPSTVSRWKQRTACWVWRPYLPASLRRNSRRSCGRECWSVLGKRPRWVHALVAA